MALLPTERHKQAALLVGFLAIGLGYAFFEYWYSPRKAEVEALEVRLEQLETSNRRAQVVVARGGAQLEERLAVYERHLARMEELIPSSEEVPVLLRSLASEALRAGVDMGDLNPQAALPGEFYTRENYEMTVVGEYHAVGRFLASVASLPRIITPVDLLLEPFSGQPINEDMVAPVVARFRIETYISPRTPDLDGSEADR